MNLLYNHPAAAAVAVSLAAYGVAIVIIEWDTVARWLR